MKETFSKELHAHIMVDDAGRARSIRHSVEKWACEENGVVQAAMGYLRHVAPVYGIPVELLANLHQTASHIDPREQGEEYRLDRIKSSFDTRVLSFYQTVKNVPVWRSGLSVTIKKGPNRVLRSTNTSKDGIEIVLPPGEVINEYKKLFAYAEVQRVAGKVKAAEAKIKGDVKLAELIQKRIMLPHVVEGKRKATKTGMVAKRFPIIRGRFWVYQYKAADRLPPTYSSPRQQVLTESAVSSQRMPVVPTLDKRIKEGRWYLVAEITFSFESEGQLRNWQLLIEPETGSWLYLRPLFAEVNGRVLAYTTNGVLFPIDPVSQNVAGVTAASNDAALSPCTGLVPLERLEAPTPGDEQALTGIYIMLSDDDVPNIDPPTEPVGDDFDYQPRTNDFAATSAYVLSDRIFNVMADLGFDIDDYFEDTTFPIHVDHRASFSTTDGVEINAYCGGNGAGGIGTVGFCLCDLSNTTNPLGRAVDSRVYWHEVCGHGILYEHADENGLFRFCHSAGDGLSLIFHDPWSSATDRFRYAPFHPTLNRRADRDVVAGWAWGGSHDDLNYGTEEIMETTLFRIYRSIGGDAPWHDRRVFASRMMMYLIFHTVEGLDPTNSPDTAHDLSELLQTADEDDWTSENVYGGAYNKVVRWAFEKQGEYQNPLIDPTSASWGTVATTGIPPAQDVYIDDGRHGEYEFLIRHWETAAIWNRRIADGLDGHQEPALNETNYMYVRIKNRGTQTATGVKVRGFHCKPGAGLSWPNDFEAFTTAEIAVGTVGPNNTEEKLVGPFEWTPDINAAGHDCVLMIVSSDEDASNADKFTTGEHIAEWRLVPNDNNIGQRNVNPVPGGGGEKGLIDGLHGYHFWLGNPNPKAANMSLKVSLPRVLVELGWKVTLQGVEKGTFKMKPREKREVIIELQPGNDFGRDVIEKATDRDIKVHAFADGSLIGGLTYRLDPEINEPYNAKRRKDCTSEAEKLLECLDVHGKDVCSVEIKEITVGIKLKKGLDCC